MDFKDLIKEFNLVVLTNHNIFGEGMTIRFKTIDSEYCYTRIIENDELMNTSRYDLERKITEEVRHIFHERNRQLKETAANKLADEFMSAFDEDLPDYKKTYFRSLFLNGDFHEVCAILPKGSGRSDAKQAYWRYVDMQSEKSCTKPMPVSIWPSPFSDICRYDLGFDERLLKNMFNVDRCLYCGTIVPEGMQVCPTCTKELTTVKPRHIYHTCPDCGANLDPGEKCDCKDKPKDLPSCDRLNISVDFSEKDEGCVVVSRNKGKGQNVVRMFYSKEAEQLYRYLINDLESTMDAIIKNEKEITND